MRLIIFLPILFVTSVRAESAPIDGAKIYKARCAMCHGATGKADTKVGKSMEIPDMSTAEWQKAVTDEAIRKAIQVGVKKESNGKKKMMPPIADIPADAVDVLIKFVRGLQLPLSGAK